MTTKISSDFPYSSNFVDVLGSKMHYIDEGEGDPILLLHSIPTHSYVWRNVIPHLSTLGRCIVPDLMGCGKSDKPAIEYTIFDHIKYIDEFIKNLRLKKMIIVMHGWGSLIGFDYAMRNENNCRGLVFYESYLRPIHGNEISLPMQEQLHALMQQKNIHVSMDGIYYIENVLPQEMLRALSEEELTHYKEPFLQKNSQKALMQYLNEILPGSNNKKINDLIENYSKKLTQSQLPKLMLYSVPGFITTIDDAIWAKKNLPNLELVEIGEELHYAQESNPMLMGETISVWLQGIEQKTTV